jgi:thiol-disulfide isomerase/thioredoxin
MHKHANFLLKICVSSLVFTTSILATNVTNVSATEAKSPNTKTAQLYACAGESPCTKQSKSVGSPLAKELHGKPLVIDVFATWCGKCKNIAPTLSQLKQKYSDKVNFVVLDVTDKGKLKVTKAMAEKLGLGKFLAENKSKPSTVAIVNPETGEILKVFKNNPNQADYTKVIDSALAEI